MNDETKHAPSSIGFFSHELSQEESEEYIFQQEMLERLHRAHEKRGFPARILGFIDDESTKSHFLTPPFMIKKDALQGYFLDRDIVIKMTDQRRLPMYYTQNTFEIFIDQKQWPVTIQPPSSGKGITVNIVCADSGDMAASILLTPPLSSLFDAYPGRGLFRLKDGPGNKCLIGVGTKERLQYPTWDRKNIGYLASKDRIMYFVRGNVAVELISSYENLGCMDLARKLDAFLVELMENAKRTADAQSSMLKAKPVPEKATATPREPKNFKEFESALNVSMESQPYVYVITSSQFFDHIRRVFEGKDNLYKEKDTYISGASFSIPGHARSRFTNMLYLVKNPAPFATYSPLKDTRSSRPRKYFFSKFNDEMIGNMSFEHRFGIWEDSPTTDVYFIRGNCVFSVSSSKVFGLFNPPDKYGALEMVLVADKNLLRKAWEMDQYFIRDPLSKLSEDEKSKLKTLDMSLPVKEELTQGKEFPLEFPRRLADGTTPA
ncbi:MAG: hypothetical protein Q4D38_15155, partial [Planctomycetia bacterium]|nr:hypothetical protein [Planctomycetia bacterium]